jgi:flagellar protein FliL
MATADTSLPSNAAPAAKVPLMTLLVCCVVSVVFAVCGAAGTMMFLARSGKLGAVGASSVTAPVKKDSEPTTHAKALEPMLINLADEGGHAYLRVGVVLAEEDDAGVKTKEEAKPVAGADAAVRDTIFDVLGRQTSTVLLAPDGKEKLKSDLMAAIGRRNPDLHVKTIYFTDFLVQR